MSRGSFVIIYGVFLLFLLNSAHAGSFIYQVYASGNRPNYTEAQEICADMGAELAIVDSQSEYDRMMDYLTDYYNGTLAVPNDFWLGAVATQLSNGSWGHMWLQCGNEHLLNWALWDGGEPNGVGTTENCSRIYSANLLYRSIDCYYGYDVMCETKDFTDCSGEETCAPLTSCWWTPPRVGLMAGFVSLGTFFCVLCVCWHHFCATKNKVDYTLDDDIDDDDINKNHDIEHMPSTRAPPPGIHSRVLGPAHITDTSWMSPEELSFHGRHAYKF